MVDAREHPTWRLRPPSLLPVDEIELALSLDAAELAYGPYLFGFAKSPLPSDGTLLSLAPIGLVRDQMSERARSSCAQRSALSLCSPLPIFRYSEY